jgi:hypothetical protein
MSLARGSAKIRFLGKLAGLTRKRLGCTHTFDLNACAACFSPAANCRRASTSIRPATAPRSLSMHCVHCHQRHSQTRAESLLARCAAGDHPRRRRDGFSLERSFVERSLRPGRLLSIAVPGSSASRLYRARCGQAIEEWRRSRSPSLPSRNGFEPLPNRAFDRLPEEHTLLHGVRWVPFHGIAPSRLFALIRTLSHLNTS